MFEFALLAATTAGAFWMAHSLVQHIARPTMKAQPIKIEPDEKAKTRYQNRSPY